MITKTIRRRVAETRQVRKLMHRLQTHVNARLPIRLPTVSPAQSDNRSVVIFINNSRCPCLNRHLRRQYNVHVLYNV